MIYKLIVNTITLSRIILSILLVYGIITNRFGFLPCTILFATVCATDLIDGKLARKYSACTSIGAIFDVLADLFFLMTASISLILVNAYPAWMLIVIIGKFLEFWCTSSFIRRNRIYKEHVFMFDSLGRKVVVLFYVLPYIALFSANYLTRDTALIVINLLCAPITVGAVISSMKRIKVCVKFRSSIYNMKQLQ